MEDVAQLIAVEYQGSLKGEHGTGRNMAPFVEVRKSYCVLDPLVFLHFVHMAYLV